MTEPSRMQSFFRRVFGLGPRPDPWRGPVSKLSDMILQEATKAGAERVHLCLQDPARGVVRWYLHGEWHEVMKMPGITVARVVHHLKSIGKLNVTGAQELWTFPLPFNDHVADFPALVIVRPDDTADVFLDCPRA